MLIVAAERCGPHDLGCGSAVNRSAVAAMARPICLTNGCLGKSLTSGNRLNVNIDVGKVGCPPIYQSHTRHFQSTHPPAVMAFYSDNNGAPFTGK